MLECFVCTNASPDLDRVAITIEAQDLNVRGKVVYPCPLRKVFLGPILFPAPLAIPIDVVKREECLVGLSTAGAAMSVMRKAGLSVFYPFLCYLCSARRAQI